MWKSVKPLESRSGVAPMKGVDPVGLRTPVVGQQARHAIAVVVPVVAEEGPDAGNESR